MAGPCQPTVCRFFDPDEEMMIEGHLGPIPSGQVRAMPGLLFGGARPTQNVIMLNQSAQVLTIPAGTVIGEAIPLDHPEAPSVICDWGHLQQAQEDIDEGKQLRQVYQLAEEPEIRERIDKLWAELDMDNASKNLSKAGRRAMRKILTRHMQVFTDEEVKVGYTDWLEMEIWIKEDARPVCAKVRPLSSAQKANLQEQLNLWLKDGVIAPAESPLGSLLVPVAKKDGETRWAVDFRALNTVTIADSFPVPCMGELLMDLAGAKYFSSLDAAQAFHNIPVKKESQALTAFITAFGTYQFQRMPFGLKNAGAMYCRLVKQLLDRLQLEGKVSAYLDNILVHTKTEEEHLHTLDKVLEAHVDAGIKLKAKKTFLIEPAVDFLGHRVSADGIALSSWHLDYIEAIKAPKSGKEVQQLVGFLQYFSSFVPHFSQLTAPMNELCNKRHLAPGDWTIECENNLQQLKASFTHPDLLRRYPLAPDDPDAGKMEVHMDFFAKGIAACLFQTQRVNGEARLRFIDTAGRKTLAYERIYHSSKGELAALHFAVNRWEHLLRAKPFIVLTDSKTVENWTTMKDPGGVIRRWLERLSLFDFEVFHRPGVDMVNADFLSRLDNLREATPSEAEDVEPLDVTYPLPFPMYEEYDNAQLTGEKCALIQPAEETQENGPVTIVDQPCGRGGRCDACFLGAAVQGCSPRRPARWGNSKTRRRSSVQSPTKHPDTRHLNTPSLLWPK